MKKKIREESEVFSELAELCSSPGYVHAIAYLCFRDNTIKHGDSMTVKDVLQQFNPTRLIRTEISTLIGLTCKNRLNTELPYPDVIQNYIDRTDTLLDELHQSMMAPARISFNPENLEDLNFNPFKNGLFLREPIFYSGEGVYQSQYRDFFKLKYQKDDSWFQETKGFTIQQATEVIASIQSLQNVKINYVALSLVINKLEQWDLLPAYKFTIAEVSKAANIETEITYAVIESFVSTTESYNFNSLDDFNPKNAYPIIKLPDEEYLLFQNYDLVQALYETPFFWLNDDKKYRPTAMQHRGDFAESFTTERLKLVFGEERVFLNIDIYTSKKNWAGEIDVLVVFANRAIILQAKSKKLTIAARKGNNNKLQEDFQKAIQDSYDQAFLCSTLILDSNYKLIDKSGNELNIQRGFKEIYPFCVVSDHYPALSFQARQFLKFRETEIIKSPFVMDVFLLDVMTEMLQSPLYFLSYINRRTFYGDRFYSSHELTILSYHLSKNLWLDGETSMMYLEDDIGAGLDLAMLTRRDGAPGLDTPKGILTDYKGTVFNQLIKEINNLDHPSILDLGFLLLSLSGETIQNLNKGFSYILKLCSEDSHNHDFTLGFDDLNSGLTIHCNNDHPSISMPRLNSHCERRKYAQKANSWFGICIDPIFQKIKFGVNLNYEWVQSRKMDEIISDMPKFQNLRGKNNLPFTTSNQKKIGRNDKCPCKSGKKYKNCCLS
ncbi:SEC-C metal-binding domain-containing protein [Adhaeribacter pallidiroseus]|uniref:Uncharacterized protein n=1 Tax=Adhaeribacter pallidiroseus TaxID=2072847 RepID=A0A369QIF1_9BACT|nr:SEC-C metal-binding domain-containing protein [Adhaeribacter pallidiroseus]RDC62649.1 hypothetical protein AHMF7616_01243 [Adhaeribacter pallidiroseus]